VGDREPEEQHHHHEIRQPGPDQGIVAVGGLAVPLDRAQLGFPGCARRTRQFFEFHDTGSQRD
jgi:hypothetical protein